MFKLNHHNFLSVTDFLNFLQENKSDNCNSKYCTSEEKYSLSIGKANPTMAEKIETSGIIPEEKFIKTNKKLITIFFDLSTNWGNNSFEKRIESVIQLLLNIKKLEENGKKVRLFFCHSGVNEKNDTVNLVTVMVKDFEEKTNVLDLSYVLANIKNELFIEWVDKDTKIAEKMQGYGFPVSFRGTEIIKQILNCLSLPNAYYFCYDLINIHRATAPASEQKELLEEFLD